MIVRWWYRIGVTLLAVAAIVALFERSFYAGLIGGFCVLLVWLCVISTQDIT